MRSPNIELINVPGLSDYVLGSLTAVIRHDSYWHGFGVKQIKDGKGQSMSTLDRTAANVRRANSVQHHG